MGSDYPFGIFKLFLSLFWHKILKLIFNFMIYTSISIGSHWQIISKRTQIGPNLMTNLYLVSNSQDNLSLRDPGFIVEADDELGARFPRRQILELIFI
jgi:hypothetical protein